jgi:hypothetical protein
LKPSRVSYQNQIKLQERIIPYKIIYSCRAKYLRLQINSNELEVVLPRRYKHEKIEDFILQKKDWILKHLKEKQIAGYYFLAKEVSVLINYDLFLKKPHIIYLNKKIIANIPAGFNSFSQNDIYNLWLKHKAKAYLTGRVKELSEITGFSYKKITIRSQKTRWGSCTSSGKLSFNYRLMRFRKEVIDYVIIHELCHRKEMNHSKKFWNLVEEYCPDYKKLKSELRK